MSFLLLLFVLSAPYVYEQNGIGFALEQPAEWVVDFCNEDGLASFSQRDGLASLSVNLFEDLLWSNALDVFTVSTREFLLLGYQQAGRSRLTQNQLKQASATDGARFHFVKHDGELKEHIVIVSVVRDNIALLLTFYLPPWREDQGRMDSINKIIKSFHFLASSNQESGTVPAPPPIK